MILNIKYNSNHPFAVEVQPTWNIATLKQEISKKYNIDLAEIRIIFQGKELANNINLRDCHLGNQTVINAVQGIHVVTQTVIVPTASREAAEDSLDAAEGGDRLVSLTPVPDNKKDQYYVYCKTCKGIQPARIRVRCSQCKEGAFTVNTDPTCWEDVLVKEKIRGSCLTQGCNGNCAEFFFKCSGPDHPAADQGSAMPLRHIRPNSRDVPCVVCDDNSNPILLFPCEEKHVTCLDCFNIYCTTKLNDRDFIFSDRHGYTVPCAGCEAGMIEEPHHFRVMGNEQYERFQRFGTEEFILQAGGVLCPAPNCGAGLLPSTSDRRVECGVQGAGGCGYVFCRVCKEAYHSGDCNRQPLAAATTTTIRAAADPNRLARARWENEQCQAMIQESTKQCPQCKVPIEKNEGCMHMKCTRCRFNWCWICEKEWNRNCQSRHWFG